MPDKQTTIPMKLRKWTRRTLTAAVLAVSGVALSGCASDAQTGGLIGAGAGAGIGAIIGHQSGHAGAGAGIGAAAGGVGGYIVGNESDKAKQRQRDAAY